MAHPFKLFLHLVTHDQKIAGIQKEIASLESAIVHYEQEKHSVEQRLQLLKQAVIDAHKHVDAIELEMKSLDVQEKEKKQALENIANYKEYQSIQSELELVQHEQIVKEQLVMDAWAVLEVAQEQLKKLQKNLEEKSNECDKLIAQEHEKIKTFLSHVHDLERERPEKERVVPDEWLEKYSVMRARITDPVITIVNGSCGSCFSSLTQQDLLRAKKGALVQCMGCYRLLYFKDSINTQ